MNAANLIFSVPPTRGRVQTNAVYVRESNWWLALYACGLPISCPMSMSNQSTTFIKYAWILCCECGAKNSIFSLGAKRSRAQLHPIIKYYLYFNNWILSYRVYRIELNRNEFSINYKWYRLAAECLFAHVAVSRVIVWFHYIRLCPFAARNSFCCIYFSFGKYAAAIHREQLPVFVCRCLYLFATIWILWCISQNSDASLLCAVEMCQRIDTDCLIMNSWMRSHAFWRRTNRIRTFWKKNLTLCSGNKYNQ